MVTGDLEIGTAKNRGEREQAKMQNGEGGRAIKYQGFL